MKRKIKRLTALRDEIFDLANSFGGDKTGAIAVELHGASNRIGTALKMLETGITQEDEDRQIDEWCDNQIIPIGHAQREMIKRLMNDSHK